MSSFLVYLSQESTLWWSSCCYQFS